MLRGIISQPSISIYQRSYNCYQENCKNPLINNSDRSQSHPGQIIKEIYKDISLFLSPSQDSSRTAEQNSKK